MTTPKSRPSAARKVTRRTEERREGFLESGLRITIEGEAFELRLGDVTPAVALELRRKVGFGFHTLTQVLATDPDIDVLSAFVWVSRRCRGEDVSFEDVQVTYEQMLNDGFSIDQPNDTTGEADGPEA